MDSTNLQLQAAIEAWETGLAAGHWQEPVAVEPICPGAWWDLIDASEAEEQKPEAIDLELPLRWAV